MTLWLILTALTGTAAVIVCAPFLLRGRSADRLAASLDVYRDQLAEVDRDKEQGLINPAEAELARTEIERRIIAAARGDSAPPEVISANWRYRTVTGIAVIVVLGSIGLYAAIGQPALFFAQDQARIAAAGQVSNAAGAGQQPVQTQNAGAQPGLGDVNLLVTRLEQRLKDNPGDPDGWRVLGWSYYNIGRFKDAVDAYRHAVELQKDNSSLKALYGEAIVKVADGTVTDEALAAFNDALAINPDDERARFFKGLAKEQKGDSRGAVDEWIALYKAAPADAEWVNDLRSRIEETARAGGIDVSARLAEARPASVAAAEAPARPGPSAQDIESAKQLKPQDRQAMAQGMVERLAGKLEASPKDADGWIMLIRSRMTLNEPDKARAALDRAKSVFADEPETQKRIDQAAQAMGVTQSN